jgi:mono/diheme cytochrome c family protein
MRWPLTFLIAIALWPAASLPVRAQKTAGSSLTDQTLNGQQKDGRRIFQQRCAVCHTLPTVVSKRYGPALYREIVQDNDDNIRDAIMEGKEGLMPGFKYGLSRAEINSVVEYLKTVSRPARPKTNANPSEGMPASAGE